MDNKILKNVNLSENYKIGDYCLIGVNPKEQNEPEITFIGKNANIRSHSVIYAGNTIGDNFHCGHGVLIRENNKIGDNVSIGTHSVIEHNVTIEDGVRIHSNVFIPEYSYLMKDCWIGPNVVFTNALHPLCPKVKQCLKGPTIHSNVKIGANATLLPEIVIGEWVLIAAGSVVTSNCDSYGVYAGNPAKFIMSVKNLKCRHDIVERPYDIRNED